MLQLQWAGRGGMGGGQLFKAIIIIKRPTKILSFQKTIRSYINQVCPFEYTTKIIIQPILLLSLCFWVCFKHP